jgi:hypothetical protein
MEITSSLKPLLLTQQKMSSSRNFKSQSMILAEILSPQERGERDGIFLAEGEIGSSKKQTKNDQLNESIPKSFLQMESTKDEGIKKASRSGSSTGKPRSQSKVGKSISQSKSALGFKRSKSNKRGVEKRKL